MAPVSKNERPVLQLPFQSIDYLLEALAAFGLLALIGLAVFSYGQLPEQIPTHFGPGGTPDGFGSKRTLWLLPVIGSVLYGLMTLLNRRPDRFNYTVNITPENAVKQYTMATRLIRIMKAVALWLFTFLVWGMVNAAQNTSAGLGQWFFPLVLLFTLGPALFYIFKSVAMK